MLSNLRDVAEYLGVDVGADDTDERMGERLSRRVYKDTDCGAWAKVVTRPVLVTEPQSWTARYAKVDGVWTLAGLSRDGQPHEFSVHGGQVRQYFFWDGADLQEHLQMLSAGRSDFTCTDTIDVQIQSGTEMVFVVGSIVEGSDAEVAPVEVTLPCPELSIDAAIEAVEAEADRLWREANPVDDE
jgi:hypothetical protein